MSGPNETWESAEETEAKSAPVSAPPSFGKAGSASDEPAESPAQSPPESPAESPADKSGTSGLPRFTLERPWWAADDTEKAGEPEEEPAPAPETNTETSTETDEDAGGTEGRRTSGEAEGSQAANDTVGTADEETPPPGDGPAPSGGESGGRARKGLLIAGGAAAVVIFAAGGYALVSGTSDDDREADKAARTPAAAQTAAAPAPAPSQQPSPPAKPANINSEKTDPKPLALTEAFPTDTVNVGGRGYVRDRSSVNHRCSLTARGRMAEALTREGCRSVVRVTFLGKEKSLAVTTGIAVLPNREVALKVSKAGDPSKYEWFRGLAGSRSKNIDRAGGYAASTVRGRYIIYAYAQYANGKEARPGDELKNVARQILDYSVRPIEARAGRPR
jgi:hypothetical protein